MQGSWVNTSPVNLCNSGPLIDYNRSTLNINYTLIPSPTNDFYRAPVIKPIEIKPIPTIEPIIFPKIEPLKLKTDPIWDRDYGLFPKKKTLLDYCV
jgi:hypothetical protein